MSTNDKHRIEELKMLINEGKKKLSIENNIQSQVWIDLQIKEWKNELKQLKNSLTK